MTDWDALFDRITSEKPPETTVLVQLFANSPEPTPFVLRLLNEEQLRDVDRAVGALKTDEEKAHAWISEPIARAIVSIDGVIVPDDLAVRHKILSGRHQPLLATLFEAYQVLDAEESDAQRAIADAKNPRGATSGPLSAPTQPGPDEPSRSEDLIVHADIPLTEARP